MRSLEERYVEPFFLRMMGTGALAAGAPSPAEIVETCRPVTPADVVTLLRMSWRPMVMGAWLSVRHDDPAVGDAAVAALRACAGSLSAPPLAVAVVARGGPHALEALYAYHARDLAGRLGAAGVVAAAVRHLRGDVVPAPSAESTAVFRGLLSVAAEIRRRHLDAVPGSQGVS